MTAPTPDDLPDDVHDWEAIFPHHADPLPDDPYDLAWLTRWCATPVHERATWILSHSPDTWLDELALEVWAEAIAQPDVWLRVKYTAQKTYIKGSDLEAAVHAWRLNHPVTAARWPLPQAPVRQHSRSAGVAPPPPLPDDCPPETPPLRGNRQGHPSPDAGNFHTIFTHYPPWAGTLWWDEFASVLMHNDRACSDTDITNIAAWCGDALGMAVTSEGQLRRGLLAVAHETARDPLQEFVQGLTWDGIPRLASWLTQYCGSPDTPYTSWVGMALGCALVTRALTPGSMQRFLVIFEGAENIGKSALCRVLGAPWARTLSRDVDTTDAQRLLQGCWVMEVPEMDSLRRADESRIKAFLSDPSDTLIQKYQNFASTYQRRTVLIGTMNPQGTGYLKGQTGNSRYLPVECTVVDLAGITAVRDQLYAEAKALVKSGYAWWEERKGLLIPEEREARREEDIYEPLVTRWLDTTGDHDHLSYITLEEVLQKALKISEPERWKDRGLQIRIGTVIHRAGWERIRRREGKLLRWVYTDGNILR